MDDYVFTNTKNGGPMDQGEWPKDLWVTALRAAGLRPRRFYATRHTFISAGLTVDKGKGDAARFSSPEYSM